MVKTRKQKKPGTEGKCYLCGAQVGKIAMRNHIKKEYSSEKGTEECYVLKIEGADNPDYWLYIDVPPTKTLTQLDDFLRKIWLECCGHMSAFRDTYGEVAKKRKLCEIPVGSKLIYEYDFGTTTTLILSIIMEIKRKPQTKAIRLLARNISQKFKCSQCEEEAKYICCECRYETDNPFYCDGCAKKHEDHEYMLPVTNSPRMGECGYAGEGDVWAP